MKFKQFFISNWKKITIVLVILVLWYFLGSVGLYIPGFGFKSGGGNLGGYKSCSCIGIPNNDIRIGGSTFYCVGIVSDCHCYLTAGFPGLNETQEVDCNFPEGKYYIDFSAEHFDYCNFFRNV